MNTATQTIPNGYKQTDIGVIPNDWHVKELGEIGEIKMCRRIFNHETAETGIIPFYKIGTFGKEADAYISQEQYEIYRRKFSFPKKGDILISAAGTIGRTIVYDGEPAYFQDSNIVWIDNNNKLTSNEYLYYVFQTVKYNTEGGTIQRLYNSIIKSAKFICPPEPQQKAIYSVLSDLDYLIQKTEKLLAKKKAIKQGAMQELLTGKKRLKGFNGEWEQKTIEDITDCLDNLRVPLNENQRLKMKGSIPYCGANGVLDYVNNYVIDDDIILIAEDGGYFDQYEFRPIAYRMTGKCWVNNHAHILKAKNNYDQGFVFYSLVHKNILNFIASGTRAKLNKSEMYKIEIYTPPTKEEQKAIAAVLTDMDTEIDNLNKKFEKYNQIKQGAMQVLLTGKVRLVKN